MLPCLISLLSSPFPRLAVPRCCTSVCRVSSQNQAVPGGGEVEKKAERNHSCAQYSGPSRRQRWLQGRGRYSSSVEGTGTLGNQVEAKTDRQCLERFDAEKTLRTTQQSRYCDENSVCKTSCLQYPHLLPPHSGRPTNPTKRTLSAPIQILLGVEGEIEAMLSLHHREGCVDEIV